MKHNQFKMSGSSAGLEIRSNSRKAVHKKRGYNTCWKAISN